MERNPHTQKLHTTQGFTLIEVLVSISIFVMVVAMSVGTVVVMIDANAKAQNIQLAATNLSFALDSMSREIRTGTFYYGIKGNPTANASNGATRNCLGCSALSFVEAGGSLTGGPGGCAGVGGGGRIAYRYNNTENSIERRLCGGSWEPMTASQVIVDDFNISVQHSDRWDPSGRDVVSPLVTFFVEARVEGVEGTGETLQLQSSITQQAIDI